ncbi:malonic semialdehyde reductase [Nocardioides yefusunii]|uniref:Malonic semialdehyde reductase n=1 Tax=Nocardioides yefusunii TaxID=2500546 RepID=A0ABW1QRI3_9ACTN|nr:malonic semialdehyde reductase [Nocardioides yefusunii]
MTDLLAIPADVQDLLFREARTANSFTDEPVTDEQLAAIYELTKFGPSAMNTQPLRVVAIRSGEAKEKLLKHMAGGNRDKTETAPLTVILAADTNFHDTLPRTFPHFPGARDMFLDDDARTEAALFNATLQAGYFIVGVRAAGLAAGPMTGMDVAGINADVLPDHLKAVMVVNIGHPGENAWFDRLPRLERDEAVIEL